MFRNDEEEVFEVDPHLYEKERREKRIRGKNKQKDKDKDQRDDGHNKRLKQAKQNRRYEKASLRDLARNY